MENEIERQLKLQEELKKMSKLAAQKAWALEEQRRKEAEALRQVGQCEMGFAWRQEVRQVACVRLVFRLSHFFSRVAAVMDVASCF